MQVEKTIPVLRMFDYRKAIEFYIDWLGFSMDWEHRFEPALPVYMQVSYNGLVLHLSEHHGDASPGAKVYLTCTGIKAYHQTLLDKKYGYNRPELEETFYGTWAFQATDPFGNRLLFNETMPA